MSKSDGRFFIFVFVFCLVFCLHLQSTKVDRGGEGLAEILSWLVTFLSTHKRQREKKKWAETINPQSLPPAQTLSPSSRRPVSPKVYMTPQWQHQPESLCSNPRVYGGLMYFCVNFKILISHSNHHLRPYQKRKNCLQDQGEHRVGSLKM